MPAELLAERLEEEAVVGDEASDPSREGVTPVSEEAKEADGGDEGAEGQETEQSTIELLTDLADELGVSPEDLYSLKVKPDNGDPMTIGELKDRVQQFQRQQQEYDTALAQAEEERRSYVERLQTITQQEEELSRRGKDAIMEMQLAEAQYKRINWDELEKLNPAQAVLEKQKLFQRHAVAEKELNEARAEAQEAMQKRFQEAKYFHDRKILQRVPEWKDPEKAKVEVEGIIRWAQSEYDFTDQELGGVIDWRYRDILRKARLYDSMKQEKEKIVSGNKPGLVINRGASTSPRGSKDSQLKQKIEAAKKSRDPAAKLAAARAVLDQSFAGSKTQRRR